MPDQKRVEVIVPSPDRLMEMCRPVRKINVRFEVGSKYSEHILARVLANKKWKQGRRNNALSQSQGNEFPGNVENSLTVTVPTAVGTLQQDIYRTRVSYKPLCTVNIIGRSPREAMYKGVSNSSFRAGGILNMPPAQIENVHPHLTMENRPCI